MRRSIQERFEEFHAANPWVFEVLVEMIQTLRARGYQHYGIGSLWEALRWRRAVGELTHAPDDEFKLNDHYRSRYVRSIIAAYPQYASMFELRALRAE
jgi:hypothetical protein